MFISAVAKMLLFISFSLAKVTAVAGRHIRRGRYCPTRRILVTGTFHNPNWFISHLSPLTQCGIEEVVLVADEKHAPMDGLTYFCPPRWLSRVLGRAVAKFLWVILAGIKFKPDLYIGYHIYPSALTSLMAARLMGRPACYQMCGGEVEVLGGGINCENRVMRCLRKPSKVLERLALSVVKEFDHVVVRGKTARDFCRRLGMGSRVSIIPGSVQIPPRHDEGRRVYDIIFVGRLAEIKQPLQVIETASLVAREISSLKVVIVGEGPMMQEMKDLSGQLGIASHIEFLGKREDVDSLLRQSKVFILTSRSEGLSIAMAEGMVAGAVPVVADVGDLRDLVRDGENGYLIEPNNIEQYVKRISGLLADDELYARLSSQAAWSGKNYNGIDVVSASWSKCIEEIVSNYPEKTDERRPKNRGKRRTPCIRKESNLSPTTSTS